MKKVLVIDDEADMRRILCRALEAFGYDVRAVEDGSAGLACCREWEPDAVVTDIFMPDQDGLETIRGLRALISRDRIIAISGGGMMGHLDVLRSARLMGAQHVLTKPFELRELQVILKDMLDSPPRSEAGTSSDTPPPKPGEA